MILIEPKACEFCKTLNSRNRANCSFCGKSLGAINVNMVSAPSELEALEKRYIDAKKKSANLALLEKFEERVKYDSKAVINFDFSTLKAIVLNGDVYKSYQKLLKENKKQIAEDVFDRKRMKVDGYMFGSWGEEITFAALSLNEQGLGSYGKIAVTLDEIAIKERATLLEENSYSFALTDQRLMKDEIPKGYRSVWVDRHKLAVVKHSSKLLSLDQEDGFVTILLRSDGNKATDHFMEIHIFGPVGESAFNKIYINPNDLLGLIQTINKEKTLLGTEKALMVYNKIKAKLGSKLVDI